MNIKFLTISAAALATLCVQAGNFAEQTPGQWRALPEVNFSSAGVAGASVSESELQVNGLSRPAKAKARVAQADMSLFDGRTIYGAMISSNEWDGVSITQVPYGVYSFEIGSNPAPVSYITDMIYGFKSAAWGRDNMYGIVPLSVMGAINGSRHIQIDTKNWTETSNVFHDTNEGTYSLMPCSMAYDPTNDTFYAFRYKEDLSGLDWVKVNPVESQYEMVAAYRGKTVVLTLAATPDGSMYYIDIEGDLYTINKENGRTSLVGNTGVTPAAYDQCMVYDNRSGSFLWAALSNEGSVLYSVNPRTAETKRVMKFKNSEQFVALYITDSTALPGAPAAVGRPQLKYSANGALDGNITFTIPSKTFDGNALSGDVNLNVWLDGENIKGVNVASGSSQSIPVTLAEGNHYVDITVDNAVGFSPMRYIYQYAGFDTPLAPGKPTMKFNDNVNEVTWQVPEGGVNKGYIDFDNLTYDVVRMPGEVKVATGLKATSFSEPTPEALQAYYYKITAINNGHVSAVAETNRVLCGDAFPVPYSQSFEDEATFNDFFKTVDNDGAGSTWRYGYSGEVRIDYIKNDQDPFDADDWLILPKVAMQNGVKYRFHMNMKTFTPSYPEDFEILVGTDPDDLTSFKSVKKEVEFTEIAKEFDDYSTDFTVDADGDYNVAVRYCSRHDENSSLMMVRNVGIDKIGMTAAPAAVSVLTVTPDAGYLLKATVAFKAPQVTLSGESLSDISYVEVMRDNESEPVHKFEPVTPGQELSWVDENVPSVGLHNYTVTAFNEAGNGESVSAEQFTGIFEAPFNADFSDKKYSRTLWSSEDNIENDPDGWYGWTWKEDSNGVGYYDLYHYLLDDADTEIWLFSPKFKLEPNTVYTVGYNGHFAGGAAYPDIEWQLAYGDDASSEGMNKISGIDKFEYVDSDMETMLVNKDAVNRHFGFGVTGATKYDYFTAKLKNFSLVRRASAFAPYRITNYKGVADNGGALKANLEFKTPEVNYYNEDLDKNEDLTIKIYQGKGATIPSYTVTAKPGENVKWTDANALHGFNYYRITCENSNGVGEVFNDTIFVGRDLPTAVENLTFKGDSDNANLRISWSKPSTGVNGGLVLAGETKYNVYSYNHTNSELTPVASNVEGESYLVDVNNLDAQKLYYYAVSAVNSEGEGKAIASSIVLGKPYELPFAESFANSSLSTQVWQVIPMAPGATAAGVTEPSQAEYNQCAGPQDNDGGCAYFYNGYQSEIFAGALLVSPKTRIDKEGGNVLSFWAYHYKEPDTYVNKGTIAVAVSADDASPEVIASFEVGGDKETGWTEHKVNLDKYKNANYISFVLMGMTPGYMDALYVDNVKLSKTSGINAVTDEDNASENVQQFDLNGLRINGMNAVQGNTIVITNGKKVMNRR